MTSSLVLRSELSRARAHLLTAQRLLKHFRQLKGPIWADQRERAEDGFLAALSWVWEEQEKICSSNGLDEIERWYYAHGGTAPGSLHDR